MQVKGGDVARLPGNVNNQKATGGVLLTQEELTKPMRDEAADAGEAGDEPACEVLGPGLNRSSGTTRTI